MAVTDIDRLFNNNNNNNNNNIIVFVQTGVRDSSMGLLDFFKHFNK